MRLTLADALGRAAAQRPDGEAVRIDGDPPVTYAALWDLARRVAAGIHAAQFSPRRVVLRHASVVRNAWYSGWCLGLRAGDRVFAAGPFCHSGGLTLHVVVSALFGATCVSLSRFDPDRALDAVEGQRCGVMSGIETLF